MIYYTLDNMSKRTYTEMQKDREIPLLPIIGTNIIPCLYSKPRLLHMLNIIRLKYEENKNQGVKQKLTFNQEKEFQGITQYLKENKENMEKEIKQNIEMIVNRKGVSRPRSRNHKISLVHLVEELDDINYLDHMPLYIFQEIYQIRYNDPDPATTTILKNVLVEYKYTLKLNKTIIKK